MDTPAILKRHPAVCLVDGLAYDNPPGSPHASRWEDVNELLDAGISVITSVNIQYIDELRERVERITGKSVTANSSAQLPEFRRRDRGGGCASRDVHRAFRRRADGHG